MKNKSQIRKAEMELKKGENMVEHEDEIFSRPARTWFQTAHEKQKSKGSPKTNFDGIPDLILS